MRRSWPLALVVFGTLALGLAAVIAGTAYGLRTVADVGYPDSAVLLRIAEFVHTGRLYPPFDRPPYLPTIYGPLTYILLSVPFAVGEHLAANPTVVTRLAVLLAVCACLAVAFLIARRLFKSTSSALLSVLFAASMFQLSVWTTQIRGDFLGVFFTLLGLLFFVDWYEQPRKRSFQIFAIVCFGLALLTKQTFVACPISIVGILLLQKRWRDAIWFAVGIGLVTIGGYGVMWLHEPSMLSHYAAVRNPILDYVGTRELVRQAIHEPLVPFAIVSGVALNRNRAAARALVAVALVAVALVSWVIAIFAVGQVGANINYFWEPLLISSIFAGQGLKDSCSALSRSSWLMTVVVSAAAIGWFYPTVRNDLNSLETFPRRESSLASSRRRWTIFSRGIMHHRILSTIPAVSVLSTVPEMPDPYLNSVMERGGTWSEAPVVANLAEQQYDAVVIRKTQSLTDIGFHGVPIWSKRLWSTLRANYHIQCTLDEWEIWIPQGRTSIMCTNIGAVPVSPGR